MTAEDCVEHKLAAMGLSAMDVTHVAHFHLHYDHCRGIEVLRHANFLIRHNELSFAYSPRVY